MGLFECKVKYQKIDENGKERNVTEPYILDATSCSDAEAVIYQEMEKFITGEFNVQQVKESRINEILMDSAGSIIYKAKVSFIALDEENGIEKRSNSNILVYADNVGEAYNSIVGIIEADSVSDFEVIGVTDSKFMDYFPAK